MQGNKMRRDWANLPDEMITLISEKVSTNTLYVHLRAVCKAWQRALTPQPRHLPRQVPLLLLPQLPCEDWHANGVDDFQLCFYDLSRSKTHRFELPDAIGKDVNGSYYGWLVLKDDDKVSLLNPITRISIDLPSLNAVDDVYWSVSQVQPRHCIQKVVLSCNPSEPDCVVVACSPPWSDWELVFCRIGDTYWNGLKMRDEYKRLLDFTCHNNSVYMVNHEREVLVYDLRTIASWTYPSKIKFNSTKGRINLVGGDAESGGPLVVNSPVCCGDINEIDVYKWFNDQQEWCQVWDIGKCVLFLSPSNCTNLQLQELGNEIYYYGLRHAVSFYSFHISIVRVNLKNSGDVLINTSLLKEFPARSGEALWFTPSLI